MPANSLYNHDIESVHVNHFSSMRICNTLREHLSILTSIFFNVGACWLTSSMAEQMFKLHFSLNYAVIPKNVVSWCIVVVLKL